jgi:hypothetical protein
MTTRKPKSDAPRTQSSLTNGTKLFDADGRSKQARRLRDLTARFTADLGGGELSAIEEMIVANAAVAKMKSEEQSAKLAAGETVSDEDAVRVGRMCSLAARDLAGAKAKRVAVVAAGLSPIDRILADLEAQRAAEPVADDDEDEVADEPFDLAAHEEPAREPAVAYQPPVEAIVEPEPAPLVAVTSEPEPIVEAPKPKLALVFNMKSGDAVGRLLNEVVAALIADGHSPTTIVDVVTPTEGLKSPLGEAIHARNVGFLLERASWFVREVAA